MISWKEVERRRGMARKTMFLKGWDACLMGKHLNDCPYSRADYAALWKSAFERCQNGEALPAYYQHREDGI